MKNLCNASWALVLVGFLIFVSAGYADETVGTLPQRMPAEQPRTEAALGSGGSGSIMVGNGSVSNAQASPQTMSTSWQSGNLTHTVKTDRKPNENAEAQAQRHKQGVDALAGAFPPTGPPPSTSGGGFANYFETYWNHTPVGQAYGYLVWVRTNQEPPMALVGSDPTAAQAQMHFEGVQELSAAYNFPPDA